MAGRPPNDPRTGEAASLVTYYIFQTGDAGRTWRYLGQQVARSSHHARKLFLAPEAEGRFVAVSQNHWRPHNKRQEVVRKPVEEEFEMPEPGSEPVEEPDFEQDFWQADDPVESDTSSASQETLAT